MIDFDRCVRSCPMEIPILRVWEYGNGYFLKLQYLYTYSINWTIQYTKWHVVFQTIPQTDVLTTDLLPMPRALANTRSTRKLGTTKSSFFPWNTVSGSSEMFPFGCSSSLLSTEQYRLLGKRSMMVLNKSMFLRWNTAVAAMFTFVRKPFLSRHGHAIHSALRGEKVPAQLERICPSVGTFEGMLFRF